MEEHRTVGYRGVPVFVHVEDEQGNHWLSQLANVVWGMDTLGRIIELTDLERGDLGRLPAQFWKSSSCAARMGQTPSSTFLQTVPVIRMLCEHIEYLLPRFSEGVESQIPGLASSHPDGRPQQGDQQDTRERTGTREDLGYYEM